MAENPHIVPIPLHLHEHEVRQFLDGKILDLETNLFKYRDWCRRCANGEWSQQIVRSFNPATPSVNLYLLFVFEDAKDAFHFRLAHQVGK